ncbi:peroxidase 29 [Selaginella moellendorffii]|nr:peroxidase 29 [Selaginella moellendorffii]XP_024543675.1 peroxidase 29 [Selaginella moellendorffii]|eukprot:XP_024543674.1 peroxidase 29 [Selaginella moellendorffii]
MAVNWGSNFAMWVILAMVLTLASSSSSQLSFGFYKKSCPGLESTVRSTIMSSLFGDPTAGAALLRLSFHDCQVGGCDASILLNNKGSITSEMASDRNFGVRELAIIDRIKAAVDAQCGGGEVSCADIVALAGRDAAAIAGGPDFPIQLGRRDATFASNRAADAALPPPTISVDKFLDIFRAMGMSIEESVAIMGAHTLGVGHCLNIVNRLYPTLDSNLNPFYAARLRISCPVSDPRFILNTTTVMNDFTSLRFDNRYYQEVSSRLGLFSIDAALGQDSRTSTAVAKFAQDQNQFFQTYITAYQKLTAHKVLTGSSGQIRKNCRYVN